MVLLTLQFIPKNKCSDQLQFFRNVQINYNFFEILYCLLIYIGINLLISLVNAINMQIYLNSFHRPTIFRSLEGTKI